MTLKRWRYTPNGRRISLLFGKRRMRIRTYGVVRGMVETPPYSILVEIQPTNIPPVAVPIKRTINTEDALTAEIPFEVYKRGIKITKEQ